MTVIANQANLKALSVGTAVQGIKAVQILTVVGLSVDPTNVVVTDGSTTWEAPCLAGYQRRAKGDVVYAHQLSGGGWVVTDKFGADQTAVSAVTSGVGNPPSDGGFRKATAIWQAVNPDGTSSLYADMTTASPQPVILPTSDAATWAGTSGARGSAVSDDTRIAAWYYGGAIQTACSGKSVTSMRVQITRLPDTGIDADVPVMLWLHAEATYAQPTLTNGWDPQVALGLGETRSIPVPASQASALASGTARGIAGFGAQSYVEYATTAPLTITFG